MSDHKMGEDSGVPLGAMALSALWVSRIALICATVLVPLLLASNFVPDGNYLAGVLFIGLAIVGLVYSLRTWADPPYWAVFLVRATAYRHRWHRPDH